MSSALSAAAWEALYAPYDQPTYQTVLELLKPEDVVVDIGAGDLRFSRQMARITRKVYAVEMNVEVLQRGLAGHDPLADNLLPICADARMLDFPPETTVGVLLMRHCTHFRSYWEKLRRVGAGRLITNARWHMSVESINLQAERSSFHAADMGWYACLCGATGFRAGPVEQWSDALDRVTHEVSDCPQCRQI
ncbi:MAG TPA: hypothetical protein VK249_27700 [Anaerolineales bacterium]|nr:hypothetical protein [Anaerolineales bacterium]